MAFIITPPNKPGRNEIPAILVSLYDTKPGDPFAHFIAVPEDGGVPPPSAGTSAHAYVAS